MDGVISKTTPKGGITFVYEEFAVCELYWFFGLVAQTPALERDYLMFSMCGFANPTV